jgi:hypothetical protein
MADKQTGTGARGNSRKQGEGHRNDQVNNPASAKNQSKQKTSTNRSSNVSDPGRETRKSG